MHNNDKAENAVNLPSLETVERLIENGQPQFGVFKQVKQINYLDYHSHLISQKPVSARRKQFKVNQFAFIQIVQPPYRICIAVASIKLASSAFAYIYNEQTQQLDVVEAVSPLTYNTVLEGDHQHGQMSFNREKISVDMQFKPEQVSLTLDSCLFAVNAVLTRGDNPLAVCSPSGRRGWTFTQKEPFSAVQGDFSFKEHSKHFETAESKVESLSFDDNSAANLDWTLGFMRHETNWFWACINSHLPNGAHFMLNLSMGVNETGVSENACWLDGEIIHLPPVMFRRGQQKEAWQISNQNLGWSKVDIQLSFEPVNVYQKTDNYHLVASIFEQWVGYYSGEIRVGDKTIVLDKVMGLAEDHFAKW